MLAKISSLLAIFLSVLPKIPSLLVSFTSVLVKILYVGLVVQISCVGSIFVCVREIIICVG